MTDQECGRSERKDRHPRDPLVKKIVALLVPRGEMDIFNNARELLFDA